MGERVDDGVTKFKSHLLSTGWERIRENEYRWQEREWLQRFVFKGSQVILQRVSNSLLTISEGDWETVSTWLVDENK